MWIGEAVTAFGMRVAAKPHIDHARAQLAATNPPLRAAAADLLVLLRVYVPSLPQLLEGEKPAVMATLAPRLAAAAEPAPAPTRTERLTGSKAAAAAAAATATEDGPAAASSAPPADDLDDLIPRVDLSAQVCIAGLLRTTRS